MAVLRDRLFLFQINHLSGNAFCDDFAVGIKITKSFKTVVHGKFFRGIKGGIVDYHRVHLKTFFECADFSEKASASAGCHIKRFGNGKRFKVLVNKSPTEL